VRIELRALDPAYPMHAGLSASVSVDTGHRRRLIGSADVAPAARTAASAR
jgi:hypothetical protein